MDDRRVWRPRFTLAFQRVATRRGTVQFSMYIPRDANASHEDVMSLLCKLPEVIQQYTPPIIAYREVCTSVGKVHGGDVPQGRAARWPISISRQ